MYGCIAACRHADANVKGDMCFASTLHTGHCRTRTATTAAMMAHAVTTLCCFKLRAWRWRHSQLQIESSRWGRPPNSEENLNFWVSHVRRIGRFALIASRGSGISRSERSCDMVAKWLTIAHHQLKQSELNIVAISFAHSMEYCHTFSYSCKRYVRKK